MEHTRGHRVNWVDSIQRRCTIAHSHSHYVLYQIARATITIDEEITLATNTPKSILRCPEEGLDGRAVNIFMYENHLKS